MKVSLIVPVYNAEKTLPAMLESIRAQRFRDFEVIFAEDAGSDASLSMLEDFCRTGGIPCKLVRQEVNRGAAEARNRAMDEASGEYLAFADADDALEPDLLEQAVRASCLSGAPADIVGWDWTLEMNTNGRTMRQSDYSTPAEALRALSGGTMRWNLWLFLVRRALVEENGIRFIPGADMGEDMQFMLRAFMCASSAVQLHVPLYRYNAVCGTSISRGLTPEKRRQIETNLAAVEGGISADAILDLKLYLKRPLLISPDTEDYEAWFSWFPEANRRARTRASLPVHTWLLQSMASRRMWMGVRLYYYIVHKLIYGVLYR